MQLRRPRYWISMFLALVAGAGLRLWFIHAYPEVDGDPLLYGDMAKDWGQHHIYGLTTDDGLHPTLIRLPGYPFFLAACFLLFGAEHYHAVMFAQTAIDLGTCLLIAALVGRIWSRRGAMMALWLWLRAFCPFTANYAATPLAESPSIFCVALGFYSLLRLLERPGICWLLAMACAMSYAAMLRPDGALLAIALCGGLVVHSLSGRGARLTVGQGLKLSILAGVLSVLPFIPWTVRNYRVFHVFQPLAPRSAMDPGEFTYPGFNRWVKTWCVDLVSTSEVYWNGNSDKIEIKNLPLRAFDTPAQYEQSKQLLDDYNQTTTLSPEIDARFEQLAEQRIHGHALRYYIALPLLRLLDMWLRPRTETLWIEMRWWDHYHHPEESNFCYFYAGLNMAYLLLSVAGLLRWPRLAGTMLAFVFLPLRLIADARCSGTALYARVLSRGDCAGGGSSKWAAAGTARHFGRVDFSVGVSPDSGPAGQARLHL